MYLLYLDDSGSAPNPSESYFVLGGVSVFERQAYWLTKELDAIAARINPSDPFAVEFHASDIFSGRRLPWSALPKPERRQVINDVLDVLARAVGSTRAFACAVHKESFPARDPVEMAFEELCSRFDLQLYRAYRSGDSQRGLMILDRSSFETSVRDLARHFRQIGTRWGVIRNLTDAPLFLESHASRLIQLADHVAYAVFRRYNAGDTSYFDRIAHRFDSHEGRLHGLVHKGSDPATCMCPACLSRRVTKPIVRGDHEVGFEDPADSSTTPLSDDGSQGDDPRQDSPR